MRRIMLYLVKREYAMRSVSCISIYFISEECYRNNKSRIVIDATTCRSFRYMSSKETIYIEFYRKFDDIELFVNFQCERETFTYRLKATNITKSSSQLTSYITPSDYDNSTDSTAKRFSRLLR